jgi:hypothetical protein
MTLFANLFIAMETSYELCSLDDLNFSRTLSVRAPKHVVGIINFASHSKLV